MWGRCIRLVGDAIELTWNPLWIIIISIRRTLRCSLWRQMSRGKGRRLNRPTYLLLGRFSQLCLCFTSGVAYIRWSLGYDCSCWTRYLYLRQGRSFVYPLWAGLLKKFGDKLLCNFLVEWTIVLAGFLIESNGCLVTRYMNELPAGWMPRNRDQLRAQRS